ncbi:ABC transporter ATP-binding protein [Allofrancisella frigidaquae]|uniref:ATP-binding cassette domain-containing protein n=1 Tax=Allofrancisella frigidaquae TaxID=1085644 RepID=A0A6M3HUI3_9GAMM|nr:ATP-binding cassette domain-containing protein [Allofrancisella frigidaquae]KEI35474.1 methionine ABC transporter ATP-binding protein [Francisella sp. W12-1067]QIV94898.1 ATP-binding cassette domain-containing protein [Allofrancisella frigidaquae]
MDKNIIEIRDLSTKFGKEWIHKDLNLDIPAKKISCIIGASGCGKTTLMREILMLQPIYSGKIFLLGQEISKLADNPYKRKQISSKMSMMFQHCALFSSLTNLQNVIFPLKQHTDLPLDILTDIAIIKLKMVGLKEEAFDKYPSEISGGMLKRVALARTIVLDPKIIFLDEPNAGLDPYSARAMDELILYLKNELEMSVVMITHDLSTIWNIVDDIIYMDNKKIMLHDTVEFVSQQTQYESIRKFFGSHNETKDMEEPIYE